MNRDDIINFLYSIYPKGYVLYTKNYIKEDEYKKYKSVLAQKKNNYGRSLRRIFEKEGYVFINFSAKEFPCFEYIVSLDKTDDRLDNDIEFIKSIGGIRRDIYIYVSKLLDCYFYVTRETSVKKNDNGEYEWSVNNIEIPQDHKKIEIKLQSFMEEKMLICLEEDFCKTILPDISTPYTGMGETTIFNLLFSSLYSYR
ncbi:MAG: hypothetical protein LBP62_08105 [Clostridiales bacterium]|jgi:hypothetical protein|nr:hypothetical protein [Clostridiales bacterium]